MKTRVLTVLASLALLAGVGAAPAAAAPVTATTSTAAVVIVPQYTFCQVVGWWHWCRTTPQTNKCFLWWCS